MERKIGEIFEFKKDWYQCVEGRCKDCHFSEKRFLCKQFITKDFCTHGIIFKKLEKNGEPYLAHDHSRNKDVIVQDYKLHSQCACYNGNEEILVFSYNGNEEILVFSYNGNKGTVTIKTNEPIYKKIKEDMEEKYSELTGIVHEYMDKDMTYKDFKEAINDWVDDYNKLNKATGKLTLKPFDLEAAKAGKPVCTRDGRKARIICFDKQEGLPIVVLVETKKNGRVTEEIALFYINGRAVSADIDSKYDLMMLPEKKEGWVNVYMEETNSNERLTEQVIYKTRKDAFDNACPRGYKATVKIEWEE